ncbi:MAG: hypothetical protein J7502_19485 [Flavisolibacter sp.]|nr:hypothetical protein [Flavisolibacter sp.]
MTNKDKTLDLLDLHLDQDFRVSPMAPNRSSEKDIHDLEKKFGIRFPEEYRIHLLGEGDGVINQRGIYVEVLENIWPRPNGLQVGPFWTFLYGLHTYTASKESEEWMRLEFVAKEFIENTGIQAIPIMKIICDPDVYCVDENSKIGIYRHEENLIEPIDMTFWDVFKMELKELRDRKDQKVNEAKQ